MEIDSQLAQLLNTLSLDSQRKLTFVSLEFHFVIAQLGDADVSVSSMEKGKRRVLSDVANTVRRRRSHVRLLRQRGFDLSGTPSTRYLAIVVMLIILIVPVSPAKPRQLLKLQRHRARSAPTSTRLRLRVPAGHPRPDPFRHVHDHERRLPRDDLHAP